MGTFVKRPLVPRSTTRWNHHWVASLYRAYTLSTTTFHCGMAAQYGKMVTRDVIPPWAETMVSNAGCHPAGGLKRLSLFNQTACRRKLSDTERTFVIHFPHNCFYAYCTGVKTDQPSSSSVFILYISHNFNRPSNSDFGYIGEGGSPQQVTQFTLCGIYTQVQGITVLHLIQRTR
jgi:hypothetical protein